MIHDHRPYWLLKLHERMERWYVRWHLAPGFESLGEGFLIMKPWNVNVHGRHISAGRNLHVITDSHRRVSFATTSLGDHQGRITIGDNVLVCPGVRFDSASAITIGDDCMFAAGAYLTDADWHGIQDRSQAVGATRPITLGNNVWVGDGAIVCKGVTIGANSVIGAGSVVTRDIPEGVIAAGNPAQVIRELDPNEKMVTRAKLFADPEKLQAEMDGINRMILKRNTLLGWLRAKVVPRRGD